MGHLRGESLFKTIWICAWYVQLHIHMLLARTKIKLFTLLSISICTLGAEAQTVGGYQDQNLSHTDLMVTVGDSISAGFLANWRARARGAVDVESLDTDFPTYDPPPSRILTDPVNHPRHTIPEWKLRVCQRMMNHKYTYSWSSGQSIHSHYEKLQEYLAQKEPQTYLDIYNVARSGSVVADLDMQANQILAAWNSGQYQNLRYLTITIGANDVCAPWYEGGNPDAEIVANVRAFFKKLSVIKQAQPIRVLFSSIPNIPQLGKPEIRHHYLTSSKTCEQRMRFQDRFCLPLMIWSGPEEYAKKVAMVAHKNDVLRDTVKQMNKDFPQFEMVFSEAMFKQNIGLDFLSKDCFHPNMDGQEKISQELWDDQPWFKTSNALLKRMFFGTLFERIMNGEGALASSG